MTTNNIPFGFGDLEIQFAGQSLALDAFTALSYGWSQDIGEMRGRGNQLLGHTTGVTNYDEGTLTVSRSAYANIVDLFGFDAFVNASEGGVVFDLVVTDTHKPTGETLKVTFEGCRPTGASVSYSQGADATNVELKFKFLKMSA